MGTRTWSRKGKLTAAGRRRAGMVGAAILDIFGDVIGDDGLPASVPAVVSVPPPVATTPPVTTLTAPPPWIKKSTDGRDELSGKFNDPNDPISVAAVEAGQRLAQNPETQLSDTAKQILAGGGSLSFADLGNTLSTHDMMAIIYEMRGWNDKPTIESWGTITSGKGTPLLSTSTGDPILFFRATRDSSGRGGVGKKAKKVTGAEKQEDLRSGREHFVGHGIYGQGTYAAASAVNGTIGNYDSRVTTPDRAVIETEPYGNKIVVFGLKAGSKIYANTSARNPEVRDDNDMIRQAVGITNGRFPIRDYGLAAAICGYDAYQATHSSHPNPDYWVVLNRSAMVVSRTTATNSYGRKDYLNNGRNPKAGTPRPNWQTGTK